MNPKIVIRLCMAAALKAGDPEMVELQRKNRAAQNKRINSFLTMALSMQIQGSWV